MKFVKKLTALFLAIVMTMAMGITAFADEAAASTFTITAPSGSHQYEIYQIFTGDLSGSTLSNVKWGTNGTGETGTAVSDEILTELKDVNSKTDKEILAVVEKYVTLSNPVDTISNGATYTAAAGYYLIKDKDNSVSGDDAYTSYIVKVVGDVTIEPKSDTPSFEKKVQDINDTTDAAAGNLQDSADYDIGDKVPFTLTGTVADNYADYDHYYFEFQDSMEQSLTFNKDSVKVTIDGTEISSDKYSVQTGTVTSGGLGGDSFSVIFNDLKDVAGVEAGSKIVVTYNATLNEKAVLGSQGNVNEAKLVYSNNPKQSQAGKPDKPGETPWDNVIVFTYKVVVNKYANTVAQGNELTGAEFTLYKKVLKTAATETEAATYTEVAIAAVKNEAGTSFTFSGLDDGDYILKETKTPAGYNTIGNITFRVNAEHEIEWTTKARTDILTSLTGTKVSGEITLTSSTDKSTLSTDIVNKSGSSLPTTGGMGTAVIYIAGIAMIVAAGVVVIARKRMA